MKVILMWLTGEKMLGMGLITLGIIAACQGEWPTAGLVISGSFAILKGDRNEKADPGNTPAP